MKKPTLTTAEAGRRGGKARVPKGPIAGLAPAERSEAMRQLAAARWGDLTRCPCGAMTAARAKARGHKC